MSATAGALSAVASILEDHIRERMNQPSRGDVVDAILGSEVNGHPMEFGDIVAMCVLLVLAGLETTSNALACAYHFLGQHEEERHRLATEPTLLDGAIEEFVRYSGSVHGLPRVATADVVVAGHEFHSGDTLVVNWAAANRDPNAFPDADKCMIDRRENRHLGFGAGVHRCLGSNLARLEMKVGLEEVLRRMPDYRSDSGVPARFSGGVNTRGFVEVPVVFTPGQRLNAISPRS
jgi:cytochrome P450